MIVADVYYLKFEFCFHLKSFYLRYIKAQDLYKFKVVKKPI